MKYATALCDQFDLSIVDDIGISVRENKWNSARNVESGKWSFLIHHRRPLLAESSIVDWLHFAKNSFVLVNRRNYIEKLPPMIGEVFDRVPGLQSTGKIRIVQKRTGIHEPELDVITAILKGHWSTLEGYTLVARR